MAEQRKRSRSLRESARALFKKHTGEGRRKGRASSAKRRVATRNGERRTGPEAGDVEVAAGEGSDVESRVSGAESWLMSRPVVYANSTNSSLRLGWGGRDAASWHSGGHSNSSSLSMPIEMSARHSHVRSGAGGEPAGAGQSTRSDAGYKEDTEDKFSDITPFDQDGTGKHRYGNFFSGAEELGNGGILSSFLSAAQNAAQHLISKSPLSATKHGSPGSITSQTEHQKAPARPADSMEKHSSFLKHLDFMLSSTPAYQSLTKENMGALDDAHGKYIDTTTPLLQDGDEDLSPDLDNSRQKFEDSLSPQIIVDFHSHNNPENQVKDPTAGSKADPLVPRETTVSGFGDGDLTLDYFDNPGEEPLLTEQLPNRVLAISTERSHHNSQAQSAANGQSPMTRQRGLTLPTKGVYGKYGYEAHRFSPSPTRSLSGVNLRKNTEPRPVSRSQVICVEENENQPVRRASTLVLPSPPSRLKRSTSFTSGSKVSEYLKVHKNSLQSAISTPSSPYEKARQTESSPYELEDVEYASARKNFDFHSLFKDTEVSSSEKLLTDYSCAWSKDILLQGRLYISTEHICFYSNILGYVSVVVIPLKEVVQIEKKNTAGIFPNAIAIHTLQKKYVFASFISRDTTFDLITNVWNQIILGPNANKTTSNQDDKDSGPNLEYQLKNDSDIDQSSAEEDSSSDSDGYESSASDAALSAMDEESAYSVPSLGAAENTIDIPSLGPLEHAPTFPQYAQHSDERKIREEVFPSPLGKIVNILYGENTDYFHQILKAQKNYDISTISPLIETKVRSYEFCKPLSGPIGPSKAVCYITETIEHYDLDDYVQVVQISKTPDIPSGNSFYVKTVTILSWAPNNGTRISVYAGIEWTGKSWIKSAVEKGTFEGVTMSSKTMFETVNHLLKVSNNKSSLRLAVSNKSTTDIPNNLPTIGPSTHPPTKNTYTKQPGDVIVDDSISIAAPLGVVYKLLFGEDTSYLQKILEKQANHNISAIPSEFSDNVREYEYIKPLNNPVGPKQTRCLIQEKILHCDVNSHIVVEQITKTPDVPSGGAFEIHTRFYLSWGKDNSTNMLVVTNIVWNGRCWIKGAIEKGSLDGQRLSTKIVVEELKAIVSKHGTKERHTPRKKTRRSKKRKSSKAGVSSTPSQFVSVGFKKKIAGIFGSLYACSSQNKVIVLLSLLLLVSLSHMLSRGTRNVQLVKPGRVIIDGIEYSYSPSEGSLYCASNMNSGNTDRTVVTSAEYGLWDWVDNRNSASVNKATPQLRDSMEEMALNHRRQELEEAVRIAEYEIQELKRKIDLLF
ncbi:ADR294Cp [Eremothecium gossypii ATCC 10895]|uniref:ADR294Cp n=1 Tax=Eremothecium gossypii (strain ATCC 10895 / CBS 109.51 / FGSC 9923 / NRRL Y-1056) TaxID=284811 RepID=Q759H0_EREGS|nr:ADR294Cp [Eremothecium gossypii ATCC 10895]AAS52215.2 ADR294Cp [Eremothecium gossypii ATCC 10895]AEY96514.1 FADR294Cp [Eremothecium gossypii FDAG1]